MNANDIAPNLYEEWGLDRRDGAHELLVLLESKDVQLQQQGQDAEEPRRAQLRIAASVLGSAAKRAEYDKACEAGLRPTWGDLGQLGAVGQWNPQPQQHAQSFQPGQPAGPGHHAHQEPRFAQTASPYGSPYSRNPFAPQHNPFPPATANASMPAPLIQPPAPEISQRAGQGARIGMAILDLFFSHSSAVASAARCFLVARMNSRRLSVLPSFCCSTFWAPSVGSAPARPSC